MSRTDGIYTQLAELRARIEALENAGPFRDKVGVHFVKDWPRDPTIEPLPAIPAEVFANYHPAVGDFEWKQRAMQADPAFEPGESAVPELVKFVESEGEK